ncbi:MAG: ABC transporter permease subunit [Comamonadaceae bacterium]|nr:ABC transporter permease subunit [Comamonadaceae bacterium]
MAERAARSAQRRAAAFWQPHRRALAALALLALAAIAWQGQWAWVPQYARALLAGVGVSLAMLAGSVALGFALALPLGIAQAADPWWLRLPARSFCTVIRGTPLLLQLWLVYYGIGSLFPLIPEIRGSALWPYLRQAWPYGLFALTVSFAAYVGEVMRGAFAGVPRGELEAGWACGMTRWQLWRRIWLPRAIQRSLPTLAGETVLQLKSTPLVATITVVDAYGVINMVRQNTLLTYEPLLLLAGIYLLLTLALVLLLRRLERRLQPVA